MKKLTVLVSALALLLSLCACSSQARGPEGDDVLPGAGAASQAVTGDQDMKPDEEPPVTPVVETRAPEPSEEPQPSSSAPEASASNPEPDTPPAPAPVPDPKPAAAPEPAPAPNSAPAPEPVPAPPPTPAPEPEPAPAADPKATAQSLIGRPVSELYAAIGRPISSDYAPGCLEPDSEDGELIYSGFTVYTVRTATREYVYDVL